jgi:DNA helicase-2/ATP-dependent DNA helicase PcrA
MTENRELNRFIDRYFKLLKQYQHSYVSLSFYNAKIRDIPYFLEKIEAHRFKRQIIYLSKALKKKIKLHNSPQIWRIVVIDMSEALFKEHILKIKENLLERLEDKKCFVSWISEYPEFANNHNIEPAVIHFDKETLNKALLFEQTIMRLKFNHFFVDFKTFQKGKFSELEITNLREKMVDDGDREKSNYFSLDSALDSNQINAVQTIEGPVRVMAPAGSGKTKVLINRILNMLNEGIPERSILALAFNKKAAKEMRQRLLESGVTVSASLTDKGVTVHTLHGFGYQIIRSTLGWSYTDDPKREKLRRIIQKAVPEFNLTRSDVNVLNQWYVKIKNELSLPIPLNLSNGNIDPQTLFLKILDQQMKESYINFDDMIYMAIRVLLTEADFRLKIGRRYSHVLVDEFQDLNASQFFLVQLLASPHNNLFVVGDDDQMIYGWRGARLDYILNFPDIFPNSTLIVLNTNYRSNKKIVQSAASLIERNENRISKNIQPFYNRDNGEISIRFCSSLKTQALQAAKWMVRLRKAQGLKWSDFAVLYRFHASGFVVSHFLSQEGIPCGSNLKPSLRETNAGKDVKRYLTLILHPDLLRPQDWRSILTKKSHFFSDEITDQIISINDLMAEARKTNDKLRERERLKAFSDIVLKYSNLANEGNIKPHILLRKFCIEVKLEHFYKHLEALSPQMDEGAETMNLEALITMAENYASLEDFYTYLSASDKILQESNDEVILTSIHATKGNEYKNVVFFNFTDKGIETEGARREEERRVAYVGISRAIERLLITAPKEKYSTFLTESQIPLPYQNWSDKKIQKALKALEKEQGKTHQQIKAFSERINSKTIAASKSFLHRLFSFGNSDKKKLAKISKKLFYLRDTKIKRLNEKMETLKEIAKMKKLLTQPKNQE